jgi:hypothetical protein
MLEKKNLSISTNQIEIKMISSIVEIFISLCKCHLQIDNLNKLIFVNKNWSIDPHVGCNNYSFDSTFACEA